jgi:hypothetical protein
VANRSPDSRVRANAINTVLDDRGLTVTDLDGLPDLTFVLQFRRDADAAGARRRDAVARSADEGGNSPPIHEAPAFGSGLTVATRITNGAVSATLTPVPGDVTFEGDIPSWLSFDTIGEGMVLDLALVWLP